MKFATPACFGRAGTEPEITRSPRSTSYISCLSRRGRDRCGRPWRRSAPAAAPEESSTDFSLWVFVCEPGLLAPAKIKWTPTD